MRLYSCKRDICQTVGASRLFCTLTSDTHVQLPVTALFLCLLPSICQVVTSTPVSVSNPITINAPNKQMQGSGSLAKAFGLLG